MQQKNTYNEKEEQSDSLKLALSMAQLLDEKKASDILLMDLRKANPYFCYFLIATANSPMQIKSLVREILKNFGPKRRPRMRTEDLDSGWVVLDFVDIVLHLFLEEERHFYNLERLWGDAKEIELPKAPKADLQDSTPNGPASNL